jgi:MEMO1 family protein
MIREAFFAGQFYPKEKKELELLLKNLFSGTESSVKNADAVVVPHAGYFYSGEVAACSFSALKKAGVYVIFSPSHTGIGKPISIFPEGKWKTPLGELEIDEEISSEIAEKLGLGFDETAHAGEHSIEVELPFIQFLHGNKPKIVAITIAEQRLGELKKLGKAVFESTCRKDAAFVASGDFTHFETLKTAKEHDLEAIKLVEKMDLDGFHKLILEKNLSICGVSPVATALQLCRETGIKRGKLLKYDTSATAGGNESSVVGYASIVFKKQV